MSSSIVYTTTLVNTFAAELEKQLDNHSAYLWGGSGQIVGKTTINEIVEAEMTSDEPMTNAVRVLNHVGEMIKQGYRLNKAQFFDCSGLVIYVLNKLGLYIGDNNADGLYYLGTSIDVNKARPGDLVFKGKKVTVYDDKGKPAGTRLKMHHVGAVVDTDEVIECKGRNYGVVKSRLNEWQYAAEYTWFETLTLNRKLKVKDKPMEGDDVRKLQKALCSHGFSCKVTGVYTTNTKDAVTKFQKAAKLSVVSYGVVAKKTAEALGIQWTK